MATTEAMPADIADFKIANMIKTPHNTRLYEEVQNLKKLVNELVDFQLAHPKSSDASDADKKEGQEIVQKEKYIRGQLSIIKALYRQSVLKVREEKSNTSDDRAVNDALILGLHNLKYEKQSLESEISAAENYEYVLDVHYAPAFADMQQPQIHEATSDSHRRIPRAIPRTCRVLGARNYDGAYRARTSAATQARGAPTREA